MDRRYFGHSIAGGILALSSLVAIRVFRGNLLALKVQLERTCGQYASKPIHLQLFRLKSLCHDYVPHVNNLTHA